MTVTDRTDLGVADDVEKLVARWDDRPIAELLADTIALLPEVGRRLRAHVRRLDAEKDWPKTWWPENGSGAERIIAERHRQLLEERYGPLHDDAHKGAELAIAAGCYALAAAVIDTASDYSLREVLDLPAEWLPGAPGLWPWPLEAWKVDDDPIRMLEKAGALCAAEIDRLRRARGDA